METSGADLLQWLDACGGNQVMAHVESCIFTGTGCGQQQSSSSVPVALQVDATALMCDSVNLAAELMRNTRGVARQAEVLINQQLARQTAAATAAERAEDVEFEDPPVVRLSLQLSQVPLPLLSAAEVQQQAVQLSSCPTGPSDGLPVSMMGVVCGISAPQDVTYSARYQCPACGSAADVRADENCLSCCNLPKQSAVEDLTGRVMVPSQQLWVTGFNSTAGHASYSVSRSPVIVQVPEQQVGSTSLGAVVHVIGHAKLNMANSSGAGCSTQVFANNIQPTLPHMMWQLPPASTSSITSQFQQRPLQTLWELLSTALGYNQPEQQLNQAIDPHLAVALLLSAAATGGKPTQQQQPAAAEQVSVLVLHESFAPSTPRMLKQAALLLSPQTVAVGAPQLAEQVLPIAGSDMQAGSMPPVFASVLLMANAGIAVADLPIMPAKARQQLLTALQQRATPPPKGHHQQLPIPLSAACWATAAWQDMPGEAAAKPKGKSVAAALTTAAQGFDLFVVDGTVHEGVSTGVYAPADQLYWMLDDRESSETDQLLQQQQEATAAVSLRNMLAAAASCDPPVLSEASQEFLGQYFLVLRQTLGNCSKITVSKPVLLSSLMRVSSAVARLHQRSEVQEQPDATLAVLLMEHTLSNKLGEDYHSVLELPCELTPSNGRTLDEQVELLHGIMATTFRQYCGTTEDADMGHGCDEDSGCSRM